MNLQTTEDWQEAFASLNPHSGFADIFIAPNINLTECTSAICIITALATKNTDTPAFTSIHIIYPRSTQNTNFEQTTRDSINLNCKSVDQDQHPKISNYIQGKTKFTAISQLETTVLARAIQETPSGTFTLVLNVDRFNSPSIPPPQARTSTHTLDNRTLHINSAEDFWVPQLKSTQAAILNTVNHNEKYTLLHVNQSAPLQKNNIQILMDLPGGLITSQPSSEEEILNKNAENWTDLIRTGRTQEAFSEIETSGLSQTNISLAKAQCLLAAGMGPAAFEPLLPLRDTFHTISDANLALIIGRIAQQTGNASTTEVLLRQAIALPDCSLPTLNAALELAILAEHEELARKAQELISTQYPNSDQSIRARYAPLFSQGAHSRIIQELRPTAEHSHNDSLARYFVRLAEAFSGNFELDYAIEIDRTHSEEGALTAADFALDCLRELLRRHLLYSATRLLLQHQWPLKHTNAAARLGVNLLRALLVARTYDLTGAESHQHQKATAYTASWLITYVAMHPDDGATRASLTTAISPEVAGLTGLTLLLALSLNDNVTHQKEQLSAARKPPQSSDLNLAAEELFTAIKRLPKFAALGAVQLDLTGLKSTPEMMLLALEQMANRTAFDSPDGDSIPLMNLILLAGTALAQKTDNLESEYELLRTGAIFFSLVGSPQAARDLAEHGLKTASTHSSLKRRRLAWIVFAETYHRTHNLYEAALGLACAKSFSDVPTTLEERYSSIQLATRIARDTGHLEIARSGVAQLSSLLSEKQQNGFNGFELSVLLASIDLLELKTDKKPISDTTARFQELAQRFDQLTARARKLKAPVLPSAILLAQVLSLASTLGITISTEIQESFKKTSAEFGLPEQTRLRAMSKPASAQPFLAEIARNLSSTRAAQDFSTDNFEGRIIARRALADASNLPAEDTAFYLDWLCDYSVSLIQPAAPQNIDLKQTGGAAVLEWAARNHMSLTPDQLSSLVGNFNDIGLVGEKSLQQAIGLLPASPADTRRALEVISASGIDIHLLGLSTQKELIQASFIDGQLQSTLETKTTFNYELFEQWEENYPYKFSKIDGSDPYGLNVTEQVMNGIGISIDFARTTPALLVMEPELLGIPGNLLATSNGHLGTCRPIATAPSLTWVCSALATNHASTGKRSSWISAAQGESADFMPVLTQLTDFTKAALDDFGFSQDDSSLPPDSLSESDIVFIGAHGGISQEGRYFRVVADEHQTRLTARKLASKCANSGIVILAVCSAGRMDSAPFNSATYGLSRTLLDYGCRAVIAPPWPLEARVMNSWLGEFLKLVTRGANVALANFMANKAVANRLCSPSAHQAMHVYGDPMFSLPIPSNEKA
ncbi:hypothetical protein [Corallococcus sp. CA049B]|uniref:hypothetical protein n=1 Tax=Corallococcus sp. CA049B TaxID=2316730 RepID=UPI0011C48E03|nr:hypothetical protein [Corallococcus sp. CA049B]